MSWWSEYHKKSQEEFNKMPKWKQYLSMIITVIIIVVVIAIITTSDPSEPTIAISDSDSVAALTDIKQSINGHIDIYKDIVSQISDGSMDMATGYNKLGRLHDFAMELFDKASQLKVSDKYKDNKQALMLSASYLEHSISHTKDYLDDKKVSTLAEAKDELQKAIQGIKTINLPIQP